MRYGSRMTMTAPAVTEAIASALAVIGEEARELDLAPRFPVEAFDRLREAGALALTVPDASGDRPVSFLEEWRAVQAVAAADGSVGRIYDGHLNAVERLAVAAPEPLRARELDEISAGRRLLGVWGADPRGNEGEPARLAIGADGEPTIEGVKTFCSGAGGLDHALVLVRGPEPGPPLVAYVDLSEGVEIDHAWYRASGMRASESHRVTFHGARVRAILGGPGELTREPWFSRDAIRTTACWAGMAHRASEAALGLLAARRPPDDLSALAAGRILSARGTIEAWLDRAGAAAQADPDAPLAALSVELREAVAGACRLILDEAARACGSHPFAVAGDLDRARRDLELFLLQHRLDPLVAARGHAALEARA